MPGQTGGRGEGQYPHCPVYRECPCNEARSSFDSLEVLIRLKLKRPPKAHAFTNHSAMVSSIRCLRGGAMQRKLGVIRSLSSAVGVRLSLCRVIGTLPGRLCRSGSWGGATVLRKGLAFGQDVVIDGVIKHTLCVVNDNDFTATATVTVGGVAVAVENPNQFFVFAFDSADLPGFAPQ